jgi:hypothetical protein
MFAGLAWILGAILFLVQPLSLTNVLWASNPSCFYSSLGNFAPLFEFGIGAYLDGRNRMKWLISLLILTLTLNMLMCTKALVELLISRITGN